VIELEKMPVKFKISVVLVGKSLKVTIPIPLAEHLQIKKGDTVVMWADDGHVVLEKQ
jgi:bifunctional DNA-binding transcriptional regulator/antitoxin component of YhaV-PrlF toxin-antitoxin module